MIKKIIISIFLFSTYASSESIHPVLETVSQNGYIIKIFSEVTPININVIHNWSIDIRDSKDNLIDDLIITVNGGMPLHSHGLPTSPKVVNQSSTGSYKLEGIKFHMAGKWEIIMELKKDNLIDVAKVSFNIR